MSLRINRLWQPGNPQLRVFLPDFWLKIVETPSYGPKRLPKNCVKFEVDKRMSRHDVREYLEKIYDLPVRDVRIEVIENIEWHRTNNRLYNKALWKDDEKKFAFVFLRKDMEFEFPKLFESIEDNKQLEKAQETLSRDLTNSKAANAGRSGVGELYGI